MPRDHFQIETVSEKRTAVMLHGHKVAIDRLTFKNSAPTHQLTWWVGGNRIRRSKARFNDALEEAKSVLRSMNAARGDVTEIPSEKLAYWRECEKKLGDTPLHVAVNFYLKNFAGAAEDKTVSDVVGEFLARKHQDEDLSARYTATLKSLLKPFDETFGLRKIRTISTEELDDYIVGDDRAPKTQLNHYLTLRSLYTFAVRRRWLPLNEPTCLDSVAPPSVKPKTPPVLTPAEMCFLLSKTDERDIPFIALMAFGSGRRAELQRLSYEDINFVERIIPLDVEKTKTSQRRTMEIPANLYEWLLPYRDWKGPIVTTWDPLWRLRERLTKEGGWEWRNNILRHSSISYHLMMHRNAPLTAELYGNSVRVINRTYKSLVTRSAAEEWYAITPEKIQSGESLIDTSA